MYVCTFFSFLESQKLHPSSLHHLVWLGLQDVPCSNKKNSSLKPGPDFHCQVFEGLQLTCNNLNCAGSETLNRLDIDAFLYAAGKIDFIVRLYNCYTDNFMLDVVYDKVLNHWHMVPNWGKLTFIVSTGVAFMTSGFQIQ